MMTITPSEYFSLSLSQRSSIDAWLALNGIDPRDFTKLVIDDIGTTVSFHIRDETGLKIREPEPVGDAVTRVLVFRTRPEL